MTGSATRLVALVALLAFLPGRASSEEREESGQPPWGQALEHSEPARERLVDRLRHDESEGGGTRWWIRPEYLLAWTRASRTPPLVTTGSTSDLTPGALGLEFTRVRYGDNIDFEDRHGYRIQAGVSLIGDGLLTIEANYFSLDGRDPQYHATSPGSPVLARPFTDAASGLPSSSVTTYPGVLSGQIDVVSDSRLQGTELNANLGLFSGGRVHLRGLAGVRYLSLREGLGIREMASVVDPTSAFAGTTVVVQDTFHAANDFYGGQLGLQMEVHTKRLTAELFGKCAFGAMEQQARIDGGTILGGQTLAGGLLALSSNRGARSRTQFDCVPEGGVRLEGALGRHILLHAGYSFLYVPRVVRPGGLVDTTVNIDLVPTSPTFGASGTPARPASRFDDTDYWAHLFQFGLTLRY